MLFINKARVAPQIRGPDASMMKFQTPLCKQCNNAKSQPFDTAEVALTEYYRANERTIVTTKSLPMVEVFPQHLNTSAEDLRRYFVKHIGCLVSDMGFAVSHNICTYLNGTNPLTDIQFAVHVCEGLFEIMERMPAGTPGVLGYDDPVSLRDPKTGKTFQISGVWTYRSLNVHWSLRWMRSVPVVNPFLHEIRLAVDQPTMPAHFKARNRPEDTAG